jgi:hypothetical protein
MPRGLLMRSLIGGLALTTLGAAPPRRTEERVVRGECREVFGAPVCVWARVAGTRVLAFGATVPFRVVAAAPAVGEMVWPPPVAAIIPLPAEVRRAVGFDHLQLSWEHHGHPPGPYLTPHFDFHFYTVTADQVRAIDCADRSKPARLPVGYALPDIDVPGLGRLEGLCVPTMGMHGVPAADLAAAGPFDHTMLVGYYGGAPIFLEPMVSRATLMERRSFGGSVPAVPSPPDGVRFPVSFRAEYDSAAEVYRLVLTIAGGH